MHGRLGEDTVRRGDPNQGIFHTISNHAQCINGGKEQEGVEILELWHLTSQVTITCHGALLSWRWLNSCLPMGSSELIPCFALLACTPFAFLIKLFLSHEFSHFYPSHSLPNPTGGSVTEWLIGLSGHMRLNHDTN